MPFWGWDLISAFVVSVTVWLIFLSGLYSLERKASGICANYFNKKVLGQNEDKKNLGMQAS